MLTYTPIRDIIMDSQTGDCPQPSECGDVDGETTFALCIAFVHLLTLVHSTEGYCSWCVCVCVCVCVCLSVCLSKDFLIVAVMIVKPRHYSK